LKNKKLRLKKKNLKIGNDQEGVSNPDVGELLEVADELVLPHGIHVR